MPLYEYQCDACGNRFEAIQKFSDPPLEVCPRCGGAVKKLQSAPAFQFKGSGWYITDYARKDQSTTDKKTGTTDEAKPSADKGGEVSSPDAKSEKSPPADAKAAKKPEAKSPKES